MTRTGIVLAVVGAALGASLAALGVWWWSAPRGTAAPQADTRPAAAPTVAHVAITLFDLSPDGTDLTAVRREIPQSPNAAEHARLVVETALERASSAEVGLWPDGTVLRTCYFTGSGEVFIDLAGLPPGGLGGGTSTERLALQAIVSAVATNIPGAATVRFLADGAPATHLAAHIDLGGALAADAQALRPAPPATVR